MTLPDEKKEERRRRGKKKTRRWRCLTCRNHGSSLCLAVEADPGRAVPVPEARRAQPVSRPWQGRGPRYPGRDPRTVVPQGPQGAGCALQRGHAHR